MTDIWSKQKSLPSQRVSFIGLGGTECVWQIRQVLGPPLGDELTGRCGLFHDPLQWRGRPGFPQYFV